MTRTLGARIDPNDTVVLFVDLQLGIIEFTKTIELERLKKGVLGLAKLARIFAMPAIVAAVPASDGAKPKIIAQLGEGVGTYTHFTRGIADALREEAIATAIKATARHTLLISGVSTEVAVQLAALTGADDGYRVFVVADACGGMSQRTEDAALRRIMKSGGDTVSVMTLAGELAGHFHTPEAQASIEVLYAMATA
jgi:nicotinamidase-related amidase